MSGWVNTKKHMVCPVSDFLLCPDPPSITGTENMKNPRSVGLAMYRQIIYMYTDVHSTPFS